MTAIYAGTGCAIFWKNKFKSAIFGKITNGHKFWDIILEK